MAGSTYSTNLKIELMTTGENSGTWGDITNTNLGTALEQAVVGYGNPDYVSDANLTISITNSNAAQPARALVLNVTSTFGSLTQTRELVVPTIQKQYIVQNNTTGGQSITVKTSAGTGITVPNGRKAHLYVDGTNVIQMFDFVDINGGAIDGTTIGASSASTGAFTTLNASGATTLDGNVTLGNASGDTVTVAGTISSNLLFTDNTYDIGASGATRPRNLFLAGAATIGGNLSVGGTLTLTGGVNLNGNVTVGDSAADTLTINSTVTSNLIFTDNTYDIGASGATRPRNLFIAGNITAGGSQTLTGALTVDSTTDSSSTTTGSIQTDGGVGVAKALFVGTTINAAGAIKSTGANLVNEASAIKISQEAVSTSTITAYGTNASTKGSLTIALKSSDGSSQETAATFNKDGLGVGITPAAKLDVSNGASPASRLRVGVGAGAASTLYSTLAAGDYVSFETNGSEVGRFLSAGNLLLGLSSALANGKLQVAGSIGLSGNTQIRQATNSDGNTLQLFATQVVVGAQNAQSYGYTGGGLLASVSNDASAVVLDVGGTTAGHRLKLTNDGTGQSGNLNYSNAGTSRFFVDSVTGFTGIGSTTSNGQLLKVGDAGTALNSIIGMSSSSAGYCALWFGDADSNVGYILYDHTSNYMAFRTNGAEVGRFTSGGSFLVGTTSTSTGIDTGSTQMFVVAPNSNFGAALTTVGDSQGRGVRFTDQSRTVTGAIDAGNSKITFGSNSSHPLTFITAGVENARIETSGNLLVGVTSVTNPSRLFVKGVPGAGGYNTNFSIANATAQIVGSEMGSNQWYPTLNIAMVRQSLTTGNGAFGGIGFSTIDDSNDSGQYDAGRIAIVNEQSSAVLSATSMAFYTQTGSVSNTNPSAERARIDSTGNLLIGTSSNITYSSQSSTGLTIVRGTARIGVQDNGDGGIFSTFSLDRTIGMSAGHTYGSGAGFAWIKFTPSGVSGGPLVAAMAGSGGASLVNGATSWSSSSDIRLKDVTGSIENALAGVMQLEPIRFTWKSDADKRPNVGITAQSVQQVVPEAVDAVAQAADNIADKTKYLVVRYQELIPLLTAALQELKTEFDAYKASHP